MAIKHFIDWDRFANFAEAQADYPLVSNGTIVIDSAVGPFGEDVLTLDTTVDNVGFTLDGATTVIVNAMCHINVNNITQRHSILTVADNAPVSSTFGRSMTLEAAPGILRVGDGTATGYGTVLAAVAKAFPLQTWFHLEVKITLGNSGNVQVRVNGKEIINVNGDFQNGQPRTYVLIQGGQANVRWGPVLIMDDSGSEFNDFIGPVRLEKTLPDADGAVANWTPSAGSNYQCIDDTIGAVNDRDDLGDRIVSSTLDQVNLASHAAFSLPNADVIHFVEVAALARQETSGDEIALRCVSNGDTATSADQTLPTSYRWVKEWFLVDPDTAAPWADAAVINAAEFGVVLRA